MPKVWNKRDASVPKDAVYIGRGTMFGNPFFMKDESKRDEVCDAFVLHWLEKCEDPLFEVMARKLLRGKDLVCWCAPKRCHGDFLLKWANE